ncbi:MAG: hypothetical protein ACWA5R_05185 [bacterium]
MRFQLLFGSLFFLLAQGIVYSQDEPAYPQADISATELLAGDADSKIADMGLKADALDYEVIITAPSYWQKMISDLVESKVENSIHIEHRNTIIESVIIRLRPANAEPKISKAKAKKKAPRKEESIKKPKPQAPKFERPDIKPVFAPIRTVVESEPPVLETPKKAEQTSKQPETENMTKTTQKVQSEEKQLAKAKAKKSEQPKSSVNTAKAVATETAQTQKLTTTNASDVLADQEEKRENTEINGSDDKLVTVGVNKPNSEDAVRILKTFKVKRQVKRTINFKDLKANDKLYVESGYVLVVRKIRSTTVRRYWLVGGIDLNAENIENVVGRKYQVTKKPKIKPVLNKTVNVDKKTSQEKKFNKGREITRSLSFNELKRNDVIYYDSEYSVVVRRISNRIHAFWLKGEIDLNNKGLFKLGSNRYRVQNQIK